MNKIRLFLTMMLLVISTLSYAQVTTSSMSGRVADANEPLIGATVRVTHEPSGTVYGAVANNEGRFNIQGMRTGGPYRAEISYLGFATYTREEIYLQLGETYTLDVVLQDSELVLEELLILGRGSKFGTEKNGSMTNINSRQMALVPTLSRSLSDYTKLSPYASGTGSFGGRPAYATNVTVDGANFNNNFGLNNGSMPGPSATSSDPISMDAIEEMQVSVAPYDVRQSNFTGAALNVVTKSGTNDYKGSAYVFFRNQDMNGKKVKDEELKINDSEKQVYGLTIGGPIIKNKLFFFLSGEIENNRTPGNTLLALQEGRSADDANVSNRVKASDLQDFSNFLKEKYGYNTGKYENWGGDNDNSRKLLAKIDWNISQEHKATVRYNYSKVSSTSRPSSSGDARPSISGGRHSKSGGMSFENSQYRSAGTLHSITGELNSQFSNSFSNKFLVAYTNYLQPREYDGGVFPFIDIMNNDESTVYMSAGTELFTYGNEVKNNTLILTDNVTYSTGNHTLTGGLSYENQYISNSYLRQGSSYYRFKNLDAFKAYASGQYTGSPWSADTHPMNFAYTYPINGNTESLSELSFGQFAAYLQDEWTMTSRFKVTYGLRIDVPMYLDGAVDNPVLRELNADGTPKYQFKNGQTIDLSTWPNTRVLWSPRLGFSYDVTEDKSIKMRGGIGVFTGRIPFVWFVNQPQNSGMLQYQLVINQSNGGAAAMDKLSRIPFTPRPSDLLQNTAISDIFPDKNVAGGRIACIDKNFKLPQVLRTSLAFDFRLPYDLSLTLEGILTKDINAIRFDNINLADAESAVKEGDDSRAYWSNSNKYITSPYTDVVVMKNTKKGMGYSLSAQLTVPEISGFSGSLAYTYSYAEEVTGKNGSDPFSAWQYRHVVNSLNSEELGLTMNNTPHRIVASANYRIDYGKNYRSTFSLFYNGYKGGAYSYIYANDANKDGSTSDLMYIPEKKADFIWKDVKLADGSTVSSWDLYQKFAENDPYLKNHAGEYASRYSAYEPFYNRLDFRFLQDFYMTVGGRKHTLQFSLDIMNIPNLLNSDWGINKYYVGSNQQVTPLRFEGIDAATGKAIVSMNNIGTSSNPKYLESAYQLPTSVSALWNIQLGLRYIF
ncbi:carboxypeptidase regulatory-like domain-containing protein [Bacteroidales bacterium OttesenSCG-928-A17]|nr:carboxypeptidase regulatory-like domain-containing protein [Bacteroidales bacterium OttesenSCG-928-A17]